VLVLAGRKKGKVMIQPTYNFKYLGLKEYLENRRFVAKQKRLEAEILLKEAETIETEMHELQVALMEVENKDEI
jgi:hypothetical protein